MKWLLALLWLTALLLAAWTLAQLPFAAIGQTLRALTLPDSLLWLLLNAAILATAAWRWRQLASALNAMLPLFTLLRLRLAGSTVNFLTPGPHLGGEPLQLYWLYRLCGLPLQRAMLVLGLDRFFELGTNFSVLLTALALLALSSTLALQDSLQVAMFLLLVLLILAGSAVVLLQQPAWMTTRLQRLAQRWQQHPRLQQIDSHWQQLGSELRAAIEIHPARLWQALGLSLLGWLLLVSELALLLHYAGVTPTLPRLLLILVAMRLAMLLPTPGGLGTVEAALLWSFQLLQLSPAAAISLMALIRLRDALVLVAGLWCLTRLRNDSRDSTPAQSA